jgi:hypothetical protein
MRKMLLAAAFALTSLTAGATLAQEKQDLTAAQQAEGRLVLETARNLVSYGETKGDALALVTAAKMVASVPGRVLADDSKGEGGADKAANFDIEGVLKKAEDLAQGDELIAKVAADVRTAAAANSKAVCYWEYYCYYNGWCEYAYACW